MKQQQQQQTNQWGLTSILLGVELKPTERDSGIINVSPTQYRRIGGIHLQTQVSCGTLTTVPPATPYIYMAGIYQEVHPYQPNVTKSCAKPTFSWAHFFKEMYESFCVHSMKGRVPGICKNIFKKVSQKNQNFRLKIGYNSGYNIKYRYMVTKS